MSEVDIIAMIERRIRKLDGSMRSMQSQRQRDLAGVRVSELRSLLRDIQSSSKEAA